MVTTVTATLIPNSRIILSKIINQWSHTVRWFQIHLLEPGAEIDEDVRAGLVQAALFAHRPA